MARAMTWEFGIKFISLFIVILFTGFFITGTGNVALIGWFITVFALLVLVIELLEQFPEEAAFPTKIQRKQKTKTGRRR